MYFSIHTIANSCSRQIATGNENGADCVGIPYWCIAPHGHDSSTTCSLYTTGTGRPQAKVLGIGEQVGVNPAISPSAHAAEFDDRGHSRLIVRNVIRKAEHKRSAQLAEKTDQRKQVKTCAISADDVHLQQGRQRLPRQSGAIKLHQAMCTTELTRRRKPLSAQDRRIHRSSPWDCSKRLTCAFQRHLWL